MLVLLFLAINLVGEHRAGAAAGVRAGRDVRRSLQRGPGFLRREERRALHRRELHRLVDGDASGRLVRVGPSAQKQRWRVLGARPEVFGVKLRRVALGHRQFGPRDRAGIPGTQLQRFKPRLIDRPTQVNLLESLVQRLRVSFDGHRVRVRVVASQVDVREDDRRGR